MLVIKKELCGECGLCVSVCPALALRLHNWGLEADQKACNGCGNCATVCPTGVLSLDGK